MSGDGAAHLRPEELVDLLEGAPIEAEVLRHFESCPECTGELRELEETLGILLKTKSKAPAPPYRRYGLWAGAAAAAAILVAVTFLYRGGPVTEPPAADAEIRLLAPIDDDRDFQILEAVLRQLPDEEALPIPQEDLPDTSELTSQELRELLEGLAREMRSRS